MVCLQAPKARRQPCPRKVRSHLQVPEGQAQWDPECHLREALQVLEAGTWAKEGKEETQGLQALASVPGGDPDGQCWNAWYRAHRRPAMWTPCLWASGCTSELSCPGSRGPPLCFWSCSSEFVYSTGLSGRRFATLISFILRLPLGVTLCTCEISLLTSLSKTQ